VALSLARNARVARQSISIAQRTAATMARRKNVSSEIISAVAENRKIDNDGGSIGE